MRNLKDLLEITYVVEGIACFLFLKVVIWHWHPVAALQLLNGLRVVPFGVWSDAEREDFPHGNPIGPHVGFGVEFLLHHCLRRRPLHRKLGCSTFIFIARSGEAEIANFGLKENTT